MTRIPHPRFLMFLGLMTLATLIAARFFKLDNSLIIGFDAGAIGFILSVLPIWHEDRVEAIRARGARDDGGRVLVLVISVIVLAAVLYALIGMIRSRDTLLSFDILLIAVTLVSSWLFVNLIYAFHYAHLYYDQTPRGDVGGLVFPTPETPSGQRETPLFADFCYFALVIGMTCQVSDVVITSTRLRRVATLHGLLAFFFNLGVLSLSVNVLSGIL